MKLVAETCTRREHFVIFCMANPQNLNSSIVGIYKIKIHSQFENLGLFVFMDQVAGLCIVI